MRVRAITDRRHLRAIFVAAFCTIASTASATGPVEFGFSAPPSKMNPFARDIWAELVTPSGQTLRLPAYYRDDGTFAVRARAVESGNYRLAAAFETSDHGEPLKIAIRVKGKDIIAITGTQPMHQVHVAAEGSPSKFIFEDGTAFQPIGSNLAWSRSDTPVPYYRKALREFQSENLNWMRIWMAHWGRLNLDWRRTGDRPAPKGSPIASDVAQSWDRIIDAAEDAGVYIQMVLQHHGQYTTLNNSNWAENPWNAVNRPGGLKKPGDFFTSPDAIAATTRKYRYIVARWGYSPAIMAWELFNEVHWVDAIARDHDEAVVAAWHEMMAARLRHFDTYAHLVTTSTENLRSPIYKAMDYFQPHLYPSNILAAVRNFEPVPAALDRPVFYGEVGDDHMPISGAGKRSGVAIVPPVWASLMGRGRYAAQPWLGWDLLEQKRLGELGAVARFIQSTSIGARDGLREFSPVVESAAEVPLTLDAGQVWRRHSEPGFYLPLDGTSPPELADVPQNLVKPALHAADGFPSRGTYRIDAPRDLAMRAIVNGVGKTGGSLRVSANGKVLAERSWKVGDAFPSEVAFTVPAGLQTLVVENPGDTDWVEVSKIDLGLPTSALAAIGKRDDSFIACWLWSREGVFAVDSRDAIDGTLVLDDVPAGAWRIEWWDTFTGKPAPASRLHHPGGALRLPTPPIARHTAVVLERVGPAPEPASPATTLMKASESPSLFASENLLAWCIIPYDSLHRTPSERIAMLKRLGFTQYVWDWRPQHLSILPEEIRLAREAGVKIRGAWLWIDAQTDSVGALSESNRAILAAFGEAHMPVEYWVGFHSNYFEGIDDEARVAKGAAMITHLRDLAAKSGSTIALYNHGDWFGEPGNQLRIIEAVGDVSVGMIYNFHHGHDQIDAFPEFLPRILPHLRAVNLNGMTPGGTKILPIGSGTRERDMIKLLVDSGYRGPIGILGHVDDVDVEPILVANLAGLRKLVDSLD